MRRFVVSLAVVCAGLMVTAVPTSAANSTGGPNREVVTDFTSTFSFTFGDQGCRFAFVWYDLILQTHNKRPGTLHIEGCVDFATGVTGGFGFVSGTFTLDDGSGRPVTGNNVSGGVFPPNLTLTVSGAKQTGNPPDSIAVVGTKGPDGTYLDPVGTVTESWKR